MASYRKLPSGLWFAEVFKLGVRQSMAHDTKAKAVAWATQLEAEILARKRGQVVKKTLRFAMERYANEISPTKKKEAWERTRLASRHASRTTAMPTTAAIAPVRLMRGFGQMTAATA